VPPTITHATNHIRNGLSGGFFSGLLEDNRRQILEAEQRQREFEQRKAAKIEK
jgi:hypothetical protein